jgi:hypothetical protein
VDESVYDRKRAGVRDLDVSKPNSARVYDWFIGGTHNYAIDRLHGQKALDVMPWAAWACKENRRWLQRAVRYAAQQGIRQFLDLGSGMPTEGHVHEIAQSVAPDARVVYVDNEPVAVGHSEIMLENVPGAAMVAADLKNVCYVVNHPTTRELLDFARPMMLILAAMLHFVPSDEESERIVAGYRECLAPGSMLAMSHNSSEDQGEELFRVQELYKNTTNPLYFRTKSEFEALFSGLELIEPGVVWTPEWRPDDAAAVPENPKDAIVLAGVARVP